MTERQRARCAAHVVFAGVIAGITAFATAGPVQADPATPYPTPVPPGAAAATPVPGQPVLQPADAPLASPPPPPVGPPPVPEIENPEYGQGQTPGKLGYLRDLWHTFHSGNPLDALSAPPEDAPGPPPGAGPPPPLPPGYISLTAPQSSTAVLPGAEQGPPPLPDAGPTPTLVPVAPTP
jgi:hypothetical protein